MLERRADSTHSHPRERLLLPPANFHLLGRRPREDRGLPPLLRSLQQQGHKERMFNKNNKVPLEFQRVRDVLLEIRDGQIYYIYRPPVPFDVRVLDVGYIRPSDGKFVRIDSYRGHLKLGPVVRPPPILVGAENYETSRVPEREGMVRSVLFLPSYCIRPVERPCTYCCMAISQQTSLSSTQLCYCTPHDRLRGDARH